MARKESSSDNAIPADVATDQPVYLVFGDDEFLVDSAAKHLVEKICPPDQQAFGLEIVIGQSDTVDEALRIIRQTMEAVSTLSFLGTQKTIWLREANIFADSVPAKSKDVKEAVEQLTQIIKSGLPDGHQLLISSSKVDKRSAFYKACDATGAVFTFKKPEKSYQQVQDTTARADKLFLERGLRINDRALSLFLDKTGMETRQIVNEIDKLECYLGSRKEVAAEDIEAIVSTSREAQAWDLADAVGHRDLVRALKVMRQLPVQDQNGVRLINGLINRFRELLIFKECMHRKWLTIQGNNGWEKASWNENADCEAALGPLNGDPRKMHPFRAGKLAVQARAFSRNELFTAYKHLSESYEKMLSSSVPGLLLLEVLICRLIAK